MARLLALALLLAGLSLALLGCSSSSSSGGSIQGGGNGSGDAAPGDAQGSGSGGGGGLAGGTPSGGGGSAAPTGGSSIGAYDPVSGPLRCMRKRKVHAYRAGGTVIQVAPKGTGPHVVFTSTQGDAQAAQIHGLAEGAEAIGPALLYVESASDGLIKVMETCLDASGTR